MNNKAFSLVIVIFVVLVFSVLGMIAASLISSQGSRILSDINGLKALHLAEAGVRYAVSFDLSQDLNWSDNAGFTKNLANGYFVISYPQKSQSMAVIQSTGVVNGISRTVSATVNRSSSNPAFGFGLFAGNQGGGPLIIQNTARVDGDFYYNGNVTMRNSASLVDGKMVSRSLTLQNFATCASWENVPVPPIDPPTFESTYYDMVLQETTKAASAPLSLSGSSVLNLDGATQYYTSIFIANNARVNGPGTLVATTGNFAISNSARIGDNVRVIVKGTSTFSNSAVIGNSVEVFSQGNVAIYNSQNFPNNNLLFTHGNLIFNNSAYFYGVILAPNGEMVSVNSTKFRGLIFADTIDLQNSTDLRGSVIVDTVGYFSNSATVTYDPAVLPAEWPIGLEGGGVGGMSVTGWREVY